MVRSLLYHPVVLLELWLEPAVFIYFKVKGTTDALMDAFTIKRISTARAFALSRQRRQSAPVILLISTLYGLFKLTWLSSNIFGTFL